MVLKVCLVVGARPNFMKVAPLLGCLRRYSYVSPLFVHTGQHYDPEMSDSFFQDLSLPKPNIHLGIGSGSHADQTARIMIAFEKVLIDHQPDAVIVVGDVNSTLACSLVAAKVTYDKKSRPQFNPMYPPDRPLLAHVEAGLRSFDRSMPEELNRIVTDTLSDLLFTTARGAAENLRREGIPAEKIFFVGNVMIDTLLAYRQKARESRILHQLGLNDYHSSRHYAVCTLHRPSNVDDRGTFLDILEALQQVGKNCPIIYPTHPRAVKSLQLLDLARYVTFSRSSDPIDSANLITCIEPLGYIDFLQLLANARLVLTDSGGIQEETTILGVPCVTIRESTERPVTISQGTNVLGGIKKDGIAKAAATALNGARRKREIPEKWDGKAAERIVEVVLTGKVDN